MIMNVLIIGSDGFIVSNLEGTASTRNFSKTTKIL